MSDVLTERGLVVLSQCGKDKGRTFAAWMQREYPSLGVVMQGDEIIVAKDAFNIAMPLWQAYFNGWYDGYEHSIDERIAERPADDA